MGNDKIDFKYRTELTDDNKYVKKVWKWADLEDVGLTYMNLEYGIWAWLTEEDYHSASDFYMKKNMS